MAGALLFYRADAAAQEDGWKTLPLVENGKIASGWVHVGYGGFAVEGGALRTDCDEKGMGLLLYRQARFGNCQIRVVYRSQNPRSNAGVFVRIDEGMLQKLDDKGPAISRKADGGLAEAALATLMKASEQERGAWYAVHHGYEVQICDDADEHQRTGSVYSLSTARPLPKKKPGDWSTMVITLDGQVIGVEVDGKQVSRFDAGGTKIRAERNWYEPKREPVRPVAGYMGLQNHDPGDVVYFKEVSVRGLKPKAE